MPAPPAKTARVGAPLPAAFSCGLLVLQSLLSFAFANLWSGCCGRIWMVRSGVGLGGAEPRRLLGLGGEVMEQLGEVGDPGCYLKFAVGRGESPSGESAEAATVLEVAVYGFDRRSAPTVELCVFGHLDRHRRDVW
jgi:hypothetical protein